VGLRNLFAQNVQRGFILLMALKEIIAMCLAILIANPGCCCGFACGEIRGEEVVHSCCSGKTSPEENDSEQEKGECFCHLKKKVSPVTEVSMLPGPSQGPDSFPSDFLNESHVFEAPSEATKFVSRWPPGYLPPPPMSRRLARHACYLL